MDILILANFCMDFSPSDNGRFKYLAEMLSNENEVEIVTSSFYHITKKQRDRIIPKLNFKLTLIDEPGYPKNICIQRFFSHWKWGKNVRKYLETRKKPDVIYCAVPSLTAACYAATFCKRNNVRFVIDIQDLWPEAFAMVLKIPVVSDIIFSPFKKKADYIYKQADAICSVSNTYCERAKRSNPICKNFAAVFLGTDLVQFDLYAKQNKVAKKPDEFWLGYAGTLGSSYDIKSVIDAVALLKNEGIIITLVILGDGPKQNEFLDYANQKGIHYIFYGRVPYVKMCGVLTGCDVVVNPITRGSAATIINKHADYAACGKPVINTQESAEYRKLVTDYHMGFNCENGSSDEMAQCLKTLFHNKELREEMGMGARKCAELLFDRRTSYRNLERVILSYGE